MPKSQCFTIFHSKSPKLSHVWCFKHFNSPCFMLNPNVSQLLTVNTPCFMLKPYDTSIFHSSTRLFRPPAAQGRAWNISSCCVRFCRSSFTRSPAAAAAVLRAAEGSWGQLRDGGVIYRWLTIHQQKWWFGSKNIGISHQKLGSQTNIGISPLKMLIFWILS